MRGTCGLALGTILALGGCGRLDFESRSGDPRGFDAPPLDVPPGVWSPPERLASLASTEADTQPTLSYDGLELFFISNRSGAAQIYRAARSARDAPFSAATLVPISGEVTVAEPALQRDGLRLYLTASAPVMEIVRTSMNGTWGAPTPVVGLDGFVGFSFADSDRRLVMTNTGGATTLYESTRTAPGFPWATPTQIAGITAPGSNNFPTTTDDSTELYWTSANTIYTAPRSASGDVGANTPLDLGPEVERASDAAISGDGTVLVFTGRTASATDDDLWMMQRVRI